MQDKDRGALPSNWTRDNNCLNAISRAIRLIYIFVYKFLIHILLWPLIMTFKRCWSEIKFALSYGRDRFEAQLMRRDHMIISSRARIIEVCIESSFQPLLQLYLVLPTLMQHFGCLSLDISETWGSFFDRLTTTSGLQFFSVITSVACLSWSLNFYKVTQKRGALDLSVNFAGRVCLILSAFLQISSRLLGFVLLAYSFGPGEFWPMILILMVHILLMSCLQYKFSKTMKLKKWTCANIITNLRDIHHCILNGISNIYLHNRITYLDAKTEKERKRWKYSKKDNVREKRTFWRQIIFNAVFTLENITIIAVVQTRIPGLIPTQLLAYILVGHLMGIMFNVVYYKFFHIWKDTFNWKGQLSFSTTRQSKRIDLKSQISFHPANSRENYEQSNT